MSFLIQSKHNDYQSFNSIENINESSSINGHSSSIHHISSSTQHALSNTTPEGIFQLPPDVVAVIAEYCFSTHFNSILPQEVRNVFYWNFKRDLLIDPKISRILNEFGCFSISESDEKFCLETIEKIRIFAKKSKIYEDPNHTFSKKIGQKIGIIARIVSPDLDIHPIIEKIQMAIDIDTCQLWALLYQYNMLNMNIEVTQIGEYLQKYESFWKALHVTKYDLFLDEQFKNVENFPKVKPFRNWFNKPENERILSSITNLELLGPLVYDPSVGDYQTFHFFQFRTFPREILKMKNLVRIHFSSDKIHYVPKEIDQLRSLTEIWLTDNHTFTPPFTKINTR